MIRDARISDAETIGKIIVKTWQTAYARLVADDYIRNMKTEKFKEIMEANIRDNLEKILVYERDKEICGFISGRTHEDYGEVIGLYVLPEEQHKGTGRRLFDEMKKWFKANGYSTMILWTLAGAKNNRFYENEHGEIFKKDALDIGNNQYDGICYTFSLDTK